METRILLPWLVTGLSLGLVAFFAGRRLKRRFAPKGGERESRRVGLIIWGLFLACCLVMRLMTAGRVLTYGGISGPFGSDVAEFLSLLGCMLGPVMADE